MRVIDAPYETSHKTRCEQIACACRVDQLRDRCRRHSRLTVFCENHGTAAAKRYDGEFAVCLNCRRSGSKVLRFIEGKQFVFICEDQIDRF